MNKLGAILTSSIITLSGLVLFPTAAYAGTSGDYFTGFSTYNIASSYPAGARAYIAPDNPQVQYVFSTPWVMIANPSYGEYAQVGWFKDPSMYEPELFTEWNAGNGYHRVFYSGYEGKTHLYTVVDTNRNGAYGGSINFYYDSYDLGQVYWNNVFVSGPANSIQYNGEVRNTGDQMPGNGYNKVEFSSVAYYDSNTGSWGSKPYVSDWYIGYNNDTGTQYAYPNDTLDNSNYSTSDYFTEWDTSATAT